MSNVVPMIAAVGGSLVGLAGVAATYLTGKNQRATALAIATLQIDQQATLAREERDQRRLEAAYRDLVNTIDLTERELRFASVSIMSGRDMDPTEKEAIAAIEAVLESDRWEFPLPVSSDRHLWSDRIIVLEAEFRFAADWVSGGIDSYNTAAFRKFEAAKKVDSEGKSRLIDLEVERGELRGYLEDLNRASGDLRTQVRAELLDIRTQSADGKRSEYDTRAIRHMHQSHPAAPSTNDEDTP